MNFTLHVWRQNGPADPGGFETHPMRDIDAGLSFLEMLDLLNERLVAEGASPIAFDHDCREGICGMCSLTINGAPHGGEAGLTVCQLHMHRFRDGDEITVEPFRAGPFPPLRDLAVDRSAMEAIQQAGGFVSIRPGEAPDANTIPVRRATAEAAMDAAACIGCGACIAACPNASAMLFTAAKLAQLNSLPQGAVERDWRTLAMVGAMDAQGFGGCTHHGECEAVCPKGVTLDVIARMNRDYARAATRKILGAGI